MRLKSVLLAVALAAAGSAWSVPSAAQAIQRIAAIVNDEVVSLYDLEARVRLVIFSARLEDTERIRVRLARQVLRNLVDERLQLQEAKKRNISVSKREIDRALTGIEQRNQLPAGELEGYLAANGIPIRTLEDQARANIAWSKLLRRRVANRISISPEEVEEYIARIRSRQGQMEYRIAEIQLVSETPQELRQVRQSAYRLVEQIRGGAPFDAVARQFSQAASAAVGGDLGWQHESELDDSLAPIIPNMSVGQVSDPIQTASGFQIMALVEKRRVASAAPSSATVDLRQVFIPLTAAAATEESEAKRALAEKAKGDLKTCADVARVAKEVGSPRPPTLGSFPISDLSPTIQTAVADLKEGQTSAPITLPDGILLLMVCGRTSPPTAIPNDETVREILFDRRLSLLSRRYMRDIRLAAVVDLRV